MNPHLWDLLVLEHAIPPCPNGLLLRPLQVPPPPLEYSDPQICARLAQSAANKRLGIYLPEPNTLDRVRSRAKNIAIVYNLLVSCGVPPAEWVTRRLYDYGQTRLPEVLGFPPASFIWSHTVCTEYLCNEWPTMCERPLIFCDAAKSIVSHWKECKISILRDPSKAPALSRMLRADIEQSAEHIHVQSAELLDVLRERARQGEYLW